ncbi:MAG: hypothetical protein GF350_07520 [Chitinivibrionales bacterium]|nr:hypothetical protein [Chitinivibrionales bacterium]
MMRWASDVYDSVARCNDGDMGTVTDLYFDEEELHIRYAAIHIEEPIEARDVLISTVALEDTGDACGIVKISLPEEKVYNSPEVNVDLPITREYEMALHRYYEWPVYWGQVSFLDTPRTKGMPGPGIPYENGARPADREREAPDAYSYDEGDYEAAQKLASGEPDDDEMKELEFSESTEERSYSSSIHSMKRLNEYTLITSDEQRFSCSNILFDNADWLLRYLEVIPAQGSRGSTVLLPVGHIRNFRSATAEIELDLSRDELMHSPPFDENISLNSYEQQLYAYYDEQGLT